MTVLPVGVYCQISAPLKSGNTIKTKIIIIIINITSIALKARRGSGFYEIFCLFANMSCLFIHLVTLFNLPCKNIFVMESIILCHKTSFLWHAPSSQSVYFGEITRVMRHICIFSRDIFSPPIFS